MPANNYPMLFVVSGVHDAKWYKIEENKAVFIKEFRQEKIKLSDKEGARRLGGKNSSVGGATDISNSLKKQEQQQQAVVVASETGKVWLKENFAHLVIAAPDHIKNEILDEIRAILPRVASKFVAGNYTKSDPHEILQLARQSLRVV